MWPQFLKKKKKKPYARGNTSRTLEGGAEVGMLGLSGGVDNRTLFSSDWRGAAASVHF